MMCAMNKENRIKRAKLGYEKSKHSLDAHRENQKKVAAEKARIFHKECKGCSALIDYAHRANSYCSRSCGAKASNRKRSLSSYQKGAKNPSLEICLFCKQSLRNS